MFKYINAAISGEYQKVLSRLIQDPETLDLTDTPTYNLANDVPKQVIMQMVFLQAHQKQLNLMERMTF